MSRRNVDLGSGSVGKLLFSLAVPTITSQIVNMLYNLVDRVYIGHMQPVADFLAVCTTATMFAVHFKKSMTALEGKPGV